MPHLAEPEVDKGLLEALKADKQMFYGKLVIEINGRPGDVIAQLNWSIDGRGTAGKSATVRGAIEDLLARCEESRLNSEVKRHDLKPRPRPLG